MYLPCINNKDDDDDDDDDDDNDPPPPPPGGILPYKIDGGARLTFQGSKCVDWYRLRCLNLKLLQLE